MLNSIDYAAPPTESPDTIPTGEMSETQVNISDICQRGVFRHRSNVSGTATDGTYGVVARSPFATLKATTNFLEEGT
jgi:3-dehydroquinate dehydratase